MKQAILLLAAISLVACDDDGIPLANSYVLDSVDGEKLPDTRTSPGTLSQITLLEGALDRAGSAMTVRFRRRIIGPFGDTSFVEHDSTHDFDRTGDVLTLHVEDVPNTCVIAPRLRIENDGRTLRSIGATASSACGPDVELETLIYESIENGSGSGK